MVHRKSTENDAVAGTDSTGMAVVSVLFDVAGPNEQANSVMQTLTNAIKLVLDPSTWIPTSNLGNKWAGLSICLSVCLFIFLYACLSIWLFVFLSLCPSIYRFV